MTHQKTLILALLSLLLTGCVAAFLAGAAGIVVYDRRSISAIDQDARIFHALHTAIVKDPRFKDSHVVVSSFNQAVLLAGQTHTASQREQVEKLARLTPHVRRIYNEITLENPTPLAQRSKDSWITSQVRTQMLTKKGLESGSIRIVTENGVVYLMGIVTHEQAQLAVDVARQINGVNKVVKVFRYII